VNEAAVPNASALGCAGLTTREGNVLAIMPHAERDAWTFNHPDSHLHLRRANSWAARPSGGSVLFESFAKALKS